MITKSGLHNKISDYFSVAIDQESKGLVKAKHGTLGFVPGLETIGKEIEGKNLPTEEANQFDPDLDEDGSDIDPNADKSNAESIVETPKEMKKNGVSEALKKVDFVIQSITSLAAKWLEFAVWASKMDYDGPTLIAGMEGNHSSAGLMLAKYKYIKDFLKERLNSGIVPEFKTMIRKMIQKADDYLGEALLCDTILLATMLHPLYLLSIFQVCFPANFDYAKDLLQKH
ncbi:hypothetical protein PTTG_03072 [Puccinia triticina 1-1 BBBD Race 1]|uniref:hAT-like transposase RNase-H fold domain-containing protein n=1 Tax=Puccinia triticina (isolate 1-1 / race 1 (BBBD)) TaxID=630390 RepID=A0A0C4EQL1_PUCT1|nr:hypothetical protein PTTG_03072 [Puccinia triticina 1-1 BBBD Race 1]